MSDVVTAAVFEQYTTIQESGAYNMLNKGGVQKEAHERGFTELVLFIEDGEYYETLLENYEAYADNPCCHECGVHITRSGIRSDGDAPQLGYEYYDCPSCDAPPKRLDAVGLDSDRDVPIFED